MVGITPEQYDTLMKPLNGTRVAKRSQGGKQLSYLEAWDVKAHLTRIFGFGNWDLEMLDYHHVADREYMSTPQSGDPKPMVEVIYAARMQLRIRDVEGGPIACYTEAAVGSASGPANMLGEHHDNALKTAASDATKRCAINLGSQFGLSLYDSGSLREVIKGTIVKPWGYVEPQPDPQQQERLAQSVGVQGAATTVEEAEQMLADRLGATEVTAEGEGGVTEARTDEEMGSPA